VQKLAILVVWFVLYNCLICFDLDCMPLCAVLAMLNWLMGTFCCEVNWIFGIFFFQWTYGLDSADLASMKVVLAGKGIFFGPNVLFWLLWFWERGRSCTWYIQFNIILTGLSVEFVAALRCQTVIVLERHDSFLFAFWVRQSTFLVRQSIALRQAKYCY